MSAAGTRAVLSLAISVVVLALGPSSVLADGVLPGQTPGPGGVLAGQTPGDLTPVTVVFAPSSAAVGDRVLLDASGSTDPDGIVVNVVWDFGDGSRAASGIEIEHVWSRPGSYTITATASDDLDLSGTTVTSEIAISPATHPSQPHPRQPHRPPPGADLCAGAPLGVRCQLGGGRQTAGGKGTGKVSHQGWPAVTGVLWILDHHGRSGTGTALNDELLGGHGSDHLSGGPGKDILWGDQWPTGNNTSQHDTLIGGPGNDWIYASHGVNIINGGPGNDTIWSYFAVHATIDAGPGNDRIWAKHGTGTINCGAGHDTIHVPLSGYILHSCETVQHYCQFGDDGHGGCRHGRRTITTLRRKQ